MKSVCGKSKCVVDGKRPVMIVPKCAAKKPASAKRLFQQSDDEEDSNDDSESDRSASSDEMDGDNFTDDDEISCDTRELQKTWAFLSPTNPEPKGKWFAVEYRGKKRRGQLLIAKLLNRFLEDEGGPIDSLEMKCLKPKVDSGMVLEDTPNHLPDDIWHFEIEDVIKGPIEVIPKGSTQFLVPAYEEIATYYLTPFGTQLEDDGQTLNCVY